MCYRQFFYGPLTDRKTIPSQSLVILFEDCHCVAYVKSSPIELKLIGNFEFSWFFREDISKKTLLCLLTIAPLSIMISTLQTVIYGENLLTHLKPSLVESKGLTDSRGNCRVRATPHV